MAGPGSNTVGNVNSNKNTLLNQYSKLTPYGANPTAAPADPNSYGGYAATVMSLQQQLAGAMALSRAGLGDARARLRMARQGANQLRVDETSSAEAGALASGTVGGSTDLAARGTAVADANAVRQQALLDKNTQVADIRNQQIQAVGSYYGGLGQAQAALANQQAMQNISRFQNDMFDTQTTNFNALRDAILKRLRSRGRVRDMAGQQQAAQNLYQAGWDIYNQNVGGYQYGRPAGSGPHPQ